MLTGVEILLERMKTNPEEFVEGGYSKWSRVLDAGWSVMTTEEQKALQDAMNEAKREHFNGEVMKVLAQGHDDHLLTRDIASQESLSYKASERYAQSWTDARGMLGGGISGASNNILTPDVMRQQVKDTLDKQFDEAYARKDQQTMKSVSKLKNAMRK